LAPPGPGEMFVDILLIPDLAIDGEAFSDWNYPNPIVELKLGYFIPLF
jgi:hypothetical protein